MRRARSFPGDAKFKLAIFLRPAIAAPSDPEEAAFCSVVRGWRLSDTLHSPLPGDGDQTQREGRKAHEGARCGCVYYWKCRGFAAPSASGQHRGVSPGPTWWRLQDAKSLKSEIINRKQIQRFHDIYIYIYICIDSLSFSPIPSEMPSQNSEHSRRYRCVRGCTADTKHGKVGGGTAAPKPTAASAHPLQHCSVPAASGALPTENKPWKRQQQQKGSGESPVQCRGSSSACPMAAPY